jgi:hypothetical protein
MLLYTEKQLDVAYRIDCKARTKSNEPWITIEDFRPIYEDLLEAYMLAHDKDAILADNLPKYLVDSVNELLAATIIIDK